MRAAIVGGAPSGKLAFTNHWDEIWGLGNQLQKYHGQPFTKLFEIHDDLSEHDPQYPLWLANHKIPLLVSEKFPVQTPEHVSVYPKERAKAIFSDGLSSSPAYMMAYAILEGATEIGIFGVDMAVNDHEYFKQRPAMYAWIGYAKGRGIKITIPDESSLCKDTYDEGRDWGKPKGPFSESAFDQMIAEHASKQKQAEANAYSHQGAIQAYEHMRKVARAIESGQQIINLKDSTEVL